MGAKIQAMEPQEFSSNLLQETRNTSKNNVVTSELSAPVLTSAPSTWDSNASLHQTSSKHVDMSNTFKNTSEFISLPPPAVVKLENVGGKVQAFTEKSFIEECTSDIGKEQENNELLQKKFLEGQEPTTIEQLENMKIKGHSERQLVMQRLMRNRSESVVVVLKNMVAPEDVDADLHGEIEEECTKFGETEKIIIYHEKQDDLENAAVIVKIFVEFKSHSSAKKAKSALHKRYFG